MFYISKSPALFDIKEWNVQCNCYCFMTFNRLIRLHQVFHCMGSVPKEMICLIRDEFWQKGSALIFERMNILRYINPQKNCSHFANLSLSNGLPALMILVFWAWSYLVVCVGEQPCAAHSGSFSSVPGLYYLPNNPLPAPLHDNPVFPHNGKCSLGNKIYPYYEPQSQ